MVLYLLFFSFMQLSIDIYIEGNELKIIKVSKLKKGMVLAKESVTLLNLEQDIDFHPDGLSMEQADLVKDRSDSLKVDKILVYQPFPFAVWMFFGVLATILARGSLINYIINIFNA
jgi:hypothetical protein